MASAWVTIPRDVRERHPLYPLGPLLVGFVISLLGSMLVSLEAMVLAVKASSHITALQIILHFYIYMQISQMVVAGLVIRNVLAARRVRVLVLMGFSAITSLAIVACLLLGASLKEVDLLEDFTERLGSEPFFVFDLVVDPLHPIIDLLSSYYLRNSEVATVGRELSEILIFTAAVLCLRDLPLGLFACFSRRLRLRCEGEAHREDEAVDPLKRAAHQFAWAVPIWFRPRPQPQIFPRAGIGWRLRRWLQERSVPLRRIDRRALMVIGTVLGVALLSGAVALTVGRLLTL